MVYVKASISANGYRKDYKSLLKQLAIVFMLVAAYFSNSTAIIIAYCFVFWMLLMFSDIEESYCMVFFAYPLSAVFDDAGFGYFFNISLGVIFLKLAFRLIRNRLIFNKRILTCICLVICLALFDTISAYGNDLFDAGYLVNFSIWLSVLVMVFTSIYSRQIDVKSIYYSLWTGYVISAGLGGIAAFTKWHGSIPLGYRFVGMLRDPNYYALLGVVLFLSALSLFSGKRRAIFSLSSLVLSVLSISKMSILLILLSVLLYIIKAIYTTFKGFNSKAVKRLFAIIIVVLIAAVVLYRTGVFDVLYDKFIYRISSNDLTTGRSYIHSYYLGKIFSNAHTFLFGRSIGYAQYFGLSFASGTNMVAHNTYIDVLMTFGVLGSAVYLYLIYKAIKNYRCSFTGNSDKIILVIVAGASLLALSYLQADGFMLMFTFVLLQFCRKERIDGGSVENCKSN